MSFFQLPLWLKGLNSSTGTDKLLAVKDNGEVTKSNKTLDEIGLTPSLQDVLAEDNTATTEGNWQFGSNRTRITSNNGVYVQNTNNQARLKTNGVIFRDISTNDSIEINFAGSTGTHAQVLQDKAGTIALTSDIPVTSNFVPYTGATANLDLGSRQLTTTGNITGGASYSLGSLPSVNLNRTSDSKNLTIIQDAAQTKNHVTLTAPSSQNGVISLDSTNQAKTITGTGDKLILDNEFADSEQSILFDSLSDNYSITAEQIGSPPLASTTLKIKNDSSTLVTFGSNISFNSDFVTSNSASFNGDLNVNGFSSAVIHTIDTNTIQSTTLLNNSFPSVSIGTKVVNLDSSQRYTYTKISPSLWRRGELMTDI